MACQYLIVIKNVIMKINRNSLCSSCLHTSDCSLTSNKSFIWSCSEYEKKDLLNTNSTPILTTNFSFTQSEREFENI